VDVSEEPKWVIDEFKELDTSREKSMALVNEAKKMTTSTFVSTNKVLPYHHKKAQNKKRNFGYDPHEIYLVAGRSRCVLVQVSNEGVY